MQKFGLGWDDTLKGVRCPDCMMLPMIRTHRKWDCSQCGYSSPNAHLDAISDYILLFGNTITNQQLRKFLLLPSCNAAKRILISMCTNYQGTTKGRIYFLPTIK